MARVKSELKRHHSLESEVSEPESKSESKSGSESKSESKSGSESKGQTPELEVPNAKRRRTVTPEGARDPHAQDAAASRILLQEDEEKEEVEEGSAATDRDALLAFYAQCGQQLENWGSDRPLGEWEGVNDPLMQQAA